jgi:chemotaxis protein histidine kinase CheA
MGGGDAGRRERRLAMFRQVAAERIARLNVLWIEGERRAGDLAPFLREAHTLKGEASLMGFAVVAKVLHAVEDYVKLVSDQGQAPAEGEGDVILSGLALALELAQGAPENKSAAADTFLAQVAEVRERPSASASVPTAPSSVPSAPAALAEGEPLAEKPTVSTLATRMDSSIRVTAEKIDHLRGMVSDLLLACLRWRQLARTTRRLREAAETIRPAGEGRQQLEAHSNLLAGLSDMESRLRDETHDLERLVGDLDGTTRDLRMLPLATMLDHFHLPLRQLARTLGRRIRFETSGERIEVDKALLEMLEEPLLHLLRNAVDHGIEPMEERLRAGKPAEAVVRVAAGLVGQRLRLVVSDDGAGIDGEAVRRRALETGLLDAASARGTDQDVLRTIFAAGFSTREHASEISGRGIGLNVVLDVVENIGGKVEVHTQPGRGTTFDIDVPLTVAITRAVLFRVGMSSYALPAVSVRGLVEERNMVITQRPGGATVDYAGVAVPLLDLCAVLDEPRVVGARGRIIIAQSGADLVALAGTDNHREREVMLKPLGRFFEKLPLVPAAVNLEEGALALVLKVAELVLLARRRDGTPLGKDVQRAAGRVALIADDSPVVRDIIAQALRAHGMHVLVASDGEEALAMLGANTRVDVVVTDIDMPRLDGLGLVRTLRSQAISKHVPVVAISMRGGDVERRAAMAAGVSAYIDKGDFSQALLWQTVRPLVLGS